MDSLILGFVLLLLVVAVVVLFAFHARPRTLIEKAADGDIDAGTLPLLALAGTAGAAGADCGAGSAGCD